MQRADANEPPSSELPNRPSTAATTSDELVEWIDEHGAVLEVVPRSRMRADNLRHRSVAIIVRSSDGRLLVHQRSHAKDLRPGWWDICAGGVVTAGESVAVAARRELLEEVGVDAEPVWIGTGRFDAVDSREVCEIYRVTSDGPFSFDDGEVVQAHLVTPDQFGELAAREPFLPGSLAMILPYIPGFEPPPSEPAAGAPP